MGKHVVFLSIAVSLLWSHPFDGRASAASANPAFVISADRTTGRFCSGSLIHGDIILTAATCKGTFLKGAFIGASSKLMRDVSSKIILTIENRSGW
jgi:Trypsin